MSLFREDLANLPSYVAGKPSTDPAIIKLSSNEMPFEPLPSIQAAITEGVGSLQEYPDMMAVNLRQRVAKFHGVDSDWVAVSNGSVNMIEKILDAACEPGDEVVCAWRSFESYPIATALAAALTIKVPVTDLGEHDLDAMAEAVTDKTAAIIVCSPNNPTGTAVTHADLARFLDRIDESIPVILDEAYIHFARMEDRVRSDELLAKHANLIVLRTFSKAYSLAGLRVGYALAHPATAETLRTVGTPFAVNALAQRAAIAALDATDKVVARTDDVVAERERVIAELADLGFAIPRSQANFMWFEMTNVEPFLAAAERHRIVVRAFVGDGVRVSIGTPEANDRIIAAAADYAKSLR